MNAHNRYEISPITHRVKREHSGSVLHFAVQLCAIAGGVFTVAGLLASISDCLASKIRISKKID